MSGDEFRTRVDNGWVPFGWHIHYPDVRLDFDGQDECGDPVWERNVNWGLSFTEQEADRNAKEARMAAMQDSVNRTIERIEMFRANGGYPRPAPRPCCHTTGPNHHHPACQENK